MRTGVGPAVHDAVGVGIERTAETSAALARRLFAGRLIVGFLALGGGSEELSGVLGGLSSRASNSAIRASAAFNWPTSGSRDRISASLSATASLARSISGVTPMLNRVARDRVNQFSGQVDGGPKPAATTQVSNY